MAECGQRPPGYTQTGSGTVTSPYPGTLVVKANANRRALTFTRSSLGGQIFLDQVSGQGGLLALNDAQPSVTIELDKWGDAVQGNWFAWASGGGVTMSWTELLCYPC